MYGDVGGKPRVRYPGRQPRRSFKEERLNSAKYCNLKINNLVGAYRISHSTGDSTS